MRELTGNTLVIGLKRSSDLSGILNACRASGAKYPAAPGCLAIFDHRDCCGRLLFAGDREARRLSPDLARGLFDVLEALVAGQADRPRAKETQGCAAAKRTRAGAVTTLRIILLGPGDVVASWAAGRHGWPPNLQTIRRGGCTRRRAARSHPSRLSWSSSA